MTHPVAIFACPTGHRRGGLSVIVVIVVITVLILLLVVNCSTLILARLLLTRHVLPATL
jgi:hypothetical protein